ncbi:MAG: nuclear transport factor 2 family protein [Myxococcaceae bacterium]|nr:nuclear transport factor 2 family protein [Myxococcaceae bacterium]
MTTSDEAVQNKQLIQRIFVGLAKGDGRLFVQSMAEDFRWTLIGTTAWSKTYVGKEAIMREVIAPLQMVLQQGPRLVAQRLIAEHDFVVVQARGDNLTKAGERYDNTYCMVFRLEQGRMLELTEYADTELVARVLGAPVRE